MQFYDSPSEILQIESCTLKGHALRKVPETAKGMNLNLGVYDLHIESKSFHWEGLEWEFRKILMLMITPSIEVQVKFTKFILLLIILNRYNKI